MPELILAYTGGSMGNVCIVAYDIESGQRLCFLGETPHYQDCYSISLCVHKNQDGNYMLMNKGALRDGLEWYDLTSALTGQFQFDVLFEKVSSSRDNSSRYYCKGEEVTQIEFETQLVRFEQIYVEIPETQIRIIHWDDLDTSDKDTALAAMADALIGSEQQFVNYNS